MKTIGIPLMIDKKRVEITAHLNYRRSRSCFISCTMQRHVKDSYSCFLPEKNPDNFCIETKHDKAIRVTLKLGAGRGSQAEAGGGASSADGGLVVSWSQVSYIIYICSCALHFSKTDCPIEDWISTGNKPCSNQPC